MPTWLTRRLLPLALLAAAGALVLVLGYGGAVATVVGITLVGSVAVLAVAWAFYEIGRSEDRAREAEAGPRSSRPGAG